MKTLDTKFAFDVSAMSERAFSYNVDQDFVRVGPGNRYCAVQVFYNCTRSPMAKYDLVHYLHGNLMLPTSLTTWEWYS